MKSIAKNGLKYNVQGQYSEIWFDTRINGGWWENGTFRTLDYFSDKNKTYIDIGCWIGPTAFYGCQINKHAFCFEPDPVAIQRFQQNLAVNNFKNITLIKKGLSNQSDISMFGGNGELGNSESSLLVIDSEFIEKGGEFPRLRDQDEAANKKRRKEGQIKIETITFGDFVKEYKIDCESVSLIKMDIEGGEKIVVPAMEEFFAKYKFAFHLSLHWFFNKHKDINNILSLLLSIYKFCYLDDLETLVTKEEITKRNLACLVFVDEEIPTHTS